MAHYILTVYAKQTSVNSLMHNKDRQNMYDREHRIIKRSE